MNLRAYAPSDEPHLLDICLRTADAGRDGSATFSDPLLVGQYFVQPYTRFAPDLCLVLADEQGPCGYVVGVADTLAYLSWFNRDWRPGLQAAHAGREARAGAVDGWLYALIRREATAPEWVADYPAHLHVDLLPRAQRQGWGRRMISRWAVQAAQRGAAGLHLGVAPQNQAAQAFYQRIGLRRLPGPEGAVMLGMKLDAATVAALREV